MKGKNAIGIEVHRSRNEQRAMFLWVAVLDHLQTGQEELLKPWLGWRAPVVLILRRELVIRSASLRPFVVGFCPSVIKYLSPLL